jgi:hypothetical protein
MNTNVEVIGTIMSKKVGERKFQHIKRLFPSGGTSYLSCHERPENVAAVN